MKHTSVLVGALMFSLGLNAVLVGMGVAGHQQPPAKPAAAPAATFKWSYTNLFKMDDPKLKLTPDQMNRLDAIRRQIDQEELRLNSQTVERWQRWTKVLVSNEVNSSTMVPCVNEMTRGTEDLMKRAAHSITAQRAVLTPEQQKIFDELLVCRMKKLVSNSQVILDGTRERMTTQYGAEYMRSIGAEPTTGTLQK